MFEKLKILSVMILLAATGCASISKTEPSLPPIDFCTTYPTEGIPTIEGSGNERASALVDQLNAVYLEKCLGISIDDLPVTPSITNLGDDYGKADQSTNRRGTIIHV